MLSRECAASAAPAMAKPMPVRRSLPFSSEEASAVARPPPALLTPCPPVVIAMPPRLGNVCSTNGVQCAQPKMVVGSGKTGVHTRAMKENAPAAAR